MLDVLSHRKDAGVKMRRKPSTPNNSSKNLIKDTRRATRKHYFAEDTILIVLRGLRDESSIAKLCRCEVIAESLYCKSWSKEVLGAGKRRLAADTGRAATRPEANCRAPSKLRWPGLSITTIIAAITRASTIWRLPMPTSGAGQQSRRNQKGSDLTPSGNDGFIT